MGVCVCTLSLIFATGVIKFGSFLFSVYVLYIIFLDFFFILAFPNDIRNFKITVIL